MPPSHQISVADDVLLDSRLALFHRRERWLALADLHFGYELSQRAAGRLVPFWGMETTSTRLLQLVHDYKPGQLILLGDLVHDRAAVVPLGELLARAAQFCRVIALAGNHDRDLPGGFALRQTYEMGDYLFHHGNRERELSGQIQVIGHHHPAGNLRDGAGLHLKFPAFIQEQNRWIMPAFSPWSAGTVWPANEQSRVWLCTPRRILPLEVREPVA